MNDEKFLHMFANRKIKDTNGLPYNIYKANTLVLQKIYDGCLLKDVINYLDDLFLYSNKHKDKLKKDRELFNRQNENFFINNKKTKDIYICSLSAIHNEILMWSHYSDNHKGFCVEYDFAVSDSEFLDFYLFKDSEDNIIGGGNILKGRSVSAINIVKYEPELTKHNEVVKSFIYVYEDTMSNLDNKKYTDDFFRYFQDYSLIYCNKYEKWSYEQEWRITVLREKKDENKDFIKIDAPNIKAIYLGIDSNNKSENETEEDYQKRKELLDRLINFAKANDIELRKMKMKHNKYELYYEIIII